MHVKSISTYDDHQAALREIEELWGANVDTEAGNRLDVLVTLILAYESWRWPIAPLDPVEATGTAMQTDGGIRT